MHQVGSPPSSGLRFSILNLWPTHRFNGDIHDLVQNAFISIVKDVRFHISCEETHVVLMFSSSFHCMQWWVYIVLFINGVHTLVNVVITNLISYHFEKNCCDDHNSGKGWVLSWPTPRGYVFIPYCGGF